MWRPSIVLLLLGFLSSCEGPFSALNPAGDKAQIIATIFWILSGIALVIWLIFISLQFYIYKIRRGPHEKKKTQLFVIGGGAVFPLLLITISIYFTLRPLPTLVAKAPVGSLSVRVSGLQWWWRVHYLVDGEEVELANEIWLPVNEPVQLYLESEDVIHSFWVPSLAGKMDTIPGRTTDLSFTPTKTGHYRGVCAEFCGTGHALMQLDVNVVERKVFDEWLARQRTPVTVSGGRGEKAFLTSGCIACHTVRGISDIGKLGPDLTHVGSRYRIGGGILHNNKTSLLKWIDHTEKIKPEVKMPSFHMLPEEDKKHLSEWLEGLK